MLPELEGPEPSAHHLASTNPTDFPPRLRASISHRSLARWVLAWRFRWQGQSTSFPAPEHAPSSTTSRQCERIPVARESDRGQRLRPPECAMNDKTERDRQFPLFPQRVQNRCLADVKGSRLPGQHYIPRDQYLTLQSLQHPKKCLEELHLTSQRVFSTILR